MKAKSLAIIAGMGSLGLLLGAFGFEYIGAMAPCQLCLWQRWPHTAAILLMGMVVLWPQRIFMLLGALAAASTAGIGIFHVGVEQRWWEGLASCSGKSIEGGNIADLLNPATNISAPVACDAIAWSLWGISMAGWNAVLSLALSALWLMAALKKD